MLTVVLSGFSKRFSLALPSGNTLKVYLSCAQNLVLIGLLLFSVSKFLILEYAYVILRHHSNTSGINEISPKCVSKKSLGLEYSDHHFFNSFVVFYMGPNTAEFCLAFRKLGLVNTLSTKSRFLD